MGTVTAVRTSALRLTRADLDALPDDGLRHELLDGAFVMTPSPGSRHQTIVTNVSSLLRDAVVPGFRVFAGPLDVALPTGDLLVPDVLVARETDVTERDVAGSPALVVEVLSPSTRRRDLGDKLTAYRDAGVPAYWVVDPEGPRLLAHELRDGAYVVVADLGPDDTWTAESPYAVTVRAADLLR